MKINIKGISVNTCWQGRRFKTKDYILYERLLLAELPDNVNIPEGKLWAQYTFGVSSKASDADNLVKPFQDILQKKYGFNDKQIYYLSVIKVDVEKGQEFVEFDIKSLSPF